MPSVELHGFKPRCLPGQELADEMLAALKASLGEEERREVVISRLADWDVLSLEGNLKPFVRIYTDAPDEEIIKKIVGVFHRPEIGIDVELIQLKAWLPAPE